MRCITCSHTVKIKKIGPKGAWPTSRDVRLNFGTPLLSLDGLKNFAGRLGVRDTKQKITKGAKGAWLRSRDLLLNFGTPLLSLDGLKLQTSNFAG